MIIGEEWAERQDQFGKEEEKRRTDRKKERGGKRMLRSLRVRVV